MVLGWEMPTLAVWLGRLAACGGDKLCKPLNPAQVQPKYFVCRKLVSFSECLPVQS